MNTNKQQPVQQKKSIPTPATIMLLALAFGIIGGFLGQAIANTRSNTTSNQEQKTIQVNTSKEESNVITATQEASPAVVSIVIKKDLPTLREIPFTPFRVPVGESQTQEVGGGSGFIVKENGLIVTNKHVVEDEQAEYVVVTNSNEEYVAEVVARDPINDIAIIKIEAENLPTLSFGNSDELQVGQTVIAIGNALAEFQNSVSVGVVSGLKRSITAGNGRSFQEDLTDIIQTDAAINQGNSGGPLLDLNGNVIGINTAIAQGGQNIGFAIPAKDVVKDIEQINKSGTIEAAYLGVQYVTLNKTIAEEEQLVRDQGAYIVPSKNKQPSIIAESPAEKAGLQEGDIITKINQQELTEESTLSSVLGEYNVGDTITITILRNKQEEEKEATLEARP